MYRLTALLYHKDALIQGHRLKNNSKWRKTLFSGNTGVSEDGIAVASQAKAFLIRPHSCDPPHTVELQLRRVGRYGDRGQTDISRARQAAGPGLANRDSPPGKARRQTTVTEPNLTKYLSPMTVHQLWASNQSSTEYFPER